MELCIVIPCLNEEETIAACVKEACDALHRHGIEGEVLVADNGSTDRSVALAQAVGARCISVPEKGYGAALMGGFVEARSRWIVFADADGSYDFAVIGRIVEHLRAGADMVVASRFRGTMEQKSMPWLHRYLGTPVLTWIHRIFFGAKISDSQSGMRGFRQDLLPLLDLRTCGMEFASEMLVKSSLLGLKVVEVPIDFRKDKRSRPPHLKTWRDGWRHLRFLLLYSPRWLFIIPGLGLMFVSGIMAALVLPGPRQITDKIGLDVHTLLCGSMGLILGYQLVLFGLYARQFAEVAGLIPKKSDWFAPVQKTSLEKGLAIGCLAIVIGVIPLWLAVRGWAHADFGAQNYAVTMRFLIPGLTLCVLGIQTIFGSFLFSLLKLKVR